MDGSAGTDETVSCECGTRRERRRTRRRVELELDPSCGPLRILAIQLRTFGTNDDRNFY